MAALDRPRVTDETPKHTERQQDEQDRETGQPGFEERPPDSATVLARLRTEYPLWGFVHGPRTRWTAVRGSSITIQRADPVALRLAVDETIRGWR